MTDVPETLLGNLRQGVAALLRSKKFLVALGGALAAILVRVSAKWGIGIDAELATQLAGGIVALATATILGQGAADVGKEAAVVKAAAEKAAVEEEKENPPPGPPPPVIDVRVEEK